MKPSKTYRPYSLSFLLKTFLYVLAVSILGFSLAACSSNSTGNGDGDNNDDGTPPLKPTFANVLTIFNNSCSGSACHIGRRESGVRLDSYENVTQSKGTQYGKLIVQVNNADGSPIIDKLESSPDIGQRMPKDRSPLSTSQINLIKEWINDGAPNN